MKNRLAFSVAVLSLVLGSASQAPANSITFTYTTIDFPGATQSVAAGINNSGEIVGGFGSPDGTRHGFLDSGGTFTAIDFPSEMAGSEATGINNSGLIVGAYDLNPLGSSHPFEGNHAFLYNPGTLTFTPPIDFPGATVTSTTAAKINDSGAIVGTYRLSNGPGNGFLDVGGVLTTLNVPVSVGCCTHANGINNAGDVVGQYKFPDANGPPQGFLDSGGVFTTVDFPGAIVTSASDINNLNSIVGSYVLTAGGPGFGFLDIGGTFFTIAFPGAKDTQALGINDAGDVVGFYADQSGLLHGFEAVPSTGPVVPEPGTLGLLGAGLVGLALWMRRRHGLAAST